MTKVMAVEVAVMMSEGIVRRAIGRVPIGVVVVAGNVTVDAVIVVGASRLLVGNLRRG